MNRIRIHSMRHSTLIRATWYREENAIDWMNNNNNNRLMLWQRDNKMKLTYMLCVLWIEKQSDCYQFTHMYSGLEFKLHSHLCGWLHIIVDSHTIFSFLFFTRHEVRNTWYSRLDTSSKQLLSSRASCEYVFGSKNTFRLWNEIMQAIALICYE